MERPSQYYPDEQDHHHQVDNDAMSDDPTPVPATFRPPPPTTQSEYHQQQQHQQEVRQQRQQLHHHQLESTMLSLSVDGTTGGIETLPSLELDSPTSPSKPSESIMMALSTTTTTSVEEKPIAERHITTLSMMRQRQQSPHHLISTSPPIQEVLVDRMDPSEDDTFFECMEDRSLARRTKRCLQQSKPRDAAPVATASNEHVLMRSLQASPDTSQPRMPTLSNQAIQSVPVQQKRVDEENNNSNNDNPNLLFMSSSTFSLSPRPQPQQHGRERAYGTEMRTGKILDGANNISTDKVVRVHESTLKALQQLKEEHVRANHRNDELTLQNHHCKQEQGRLRQELETLRLHSDQNQSELTRLKQDYDRLHILHETLTNEHETVTKQKLELEGQLREANRTIKDLRHRTLAADNRRKELKGQVDKLNRELEESLADKGNLATEVSQLRIEQVETEKENAELKAQLADVILERDQGRSELGKLEEQLHSKQEKLEQFQASHEQEVDRLNKSLRKANDTMHKLRAELVAKATIARDIASSPRFNVSDKTSKYKSVCGAFQDTPSVVVPTPDLDSAIADRLARLRDSAERAHLIRAHKRDLAKVKAERDNAIQTLEAEHSDALKKAVKQFEQKRLKNLEELTQRLQQQHDSQLEEVEEEKRKTIAQLQKEKAKLQEESDESLQEALSRAARLTQDCNRESNRRMALETKVDELQEQMQIEKREWQTRCTEEMERRRQDWEAERETMIVGLQKDVNTAFDSRRRNGVGHGRNGASTPVHASSNSPRHGHPPLSSQQPQQPPRPSLLSVNSAMFFSEKAVNTVSPTFGGGGDRPTYTASLPSRSRQSSPSEGRLEGSPSLISQSFSDIDSALRETEELVHSIL